MEVDGPAAILAMEAAARMDQEPMMDNKLEERLREFSKWHRTSFYGIPDYGVLADRAADEITRLNALVDELVEGLEAVAAAMLKGGDGAEGDFGWNVTALNKVRPLIRALLAQPPVSHDQ